MLALAFFAPGFMVGRNDHSPYLWAADMAIGAATCCFLILCARHAYAGDTRSFAPRILESRWAVRLGVFSYSLYLIHSLFIIYYARLLQRFHVGHLSSPPAFFLICTFGSLVASYVFFLVIERRFLPGHLRTESRDALATAIAPAP